MPGSPILCLKGKRLMMFQLSGFYCSFVRNPRPQKGRTRAHWETWKLRSSESHSEFEHLLGLHRFCTLNPKTLDLSP